MNKNEIATRVSEAADLTSAQASAALDAVLDAVADAVARGEKVALAGFGTFEARGRSARSGRNPQTGEALEIAATTVPAFKPATAFKRRVADA